MRKETIIALSTFILNLFWFFAATKNVYHTVFVGVVFEILWLPMLIMLAVLPVLLLFNWQKKQWSFKTIYPYCLLMNLSTVLLLFFNL
jgi:hypothetical protein